MVEPDMWKLVWKLGGPPKHSQFIWRACKGSLAVRERLCYHHIIQEKNCQVCGGEIESIIHSLFDCKAVKEIWGHSEFDELISDAPHTSIAHRFCWVAGRLNLDEVKSFTTLAWAAWLCRNKILFEQQRLVTIPTANTNNSSRSHRSRDGRQPSERQFSSIPDYF